MAGFGALSWGAVDDISGGGWTNTNTPIVTTSVNDPFIEAGTVSYSINDDNAAAAEARNKVLPLTEDGTHYFSIFVKSGTATATDIRVQDTTAASTLARVRITWSGTVPTPTIAAGSGLILATIRVAAGNQWYLILFSADAVVAANVNQLQLYGATSTTASDTGTTLYYLRNVVLVDLLDQLIAYPLPRAGSEWVQGTSGIEDAWVSGTDYYLEGTSQWIPALPTTWPVAVHGWDGRNESIGVDCSVTAMLAAGRDKQVVKYVPDRDTFPTWFDGYLHAPLDERNVALHGNGQRQIRLALRGASPYPGAA